MRVHVGVAHHLGWAVVVAADDELNVTDRRRVELIDEHLPAAPVHHRGGAHPMHDTGDSLDDTELEALVDEVRSSARRRTRSALDRLVDDVGRIRSISLRDWPADLPTDIPTQRRAPFESQMDSVMYRQVFAELATENGWEQHRFDASSVEAAATDILGDRADDVLRRPRDILGAPWNKDHRTALAAIVVALNP